MRIGASLPRNMSINDDHAPRPKLSHGLPAVVQADTRLLVLGSFPGQASLQAQQYYGHARNQFWPMLSALWGIDLMAMAYAARLRAMRGHGVGLWDMYAACRRPGSLDSAIREAQPNDLAGLVRGLPALRAIAHNGAESARTMRLTATLGVAVHRLPSTSPAHASWSFERKLASWRAVFAEHGLA